jgi:hypothetical protein
MKFLLGLLHVMIMGSAYAQTNLPACQGSLLYVMLTPIGKTYLEQRGVRWLLQKSFGFKTKE